MASRAATECIRGERNAMTTTDPPAATATGAPISDAEIVDVLARHAAGKNPRWSDIDVLTAEMERLRAELARREQRRRLLQPPTCPIGLSTCPNGRKSDDVIFGPSSWPCGACGAELV